MSADGILALHGNLGRPEDWEQLGLAGVRAVRLWDYAELSFHEFSHELATTLSEGMERPVLAGYSLGGRLALHALAMHPDRWRAAVIASAHPGLENGEERRARRGSDETWAARARESSWENFLELWDAQAVLASSFSPPDRAGLEKDRKSVALAFETWSLGRQENLRSHLRRFHGSVLWVTGEKDARFTALGEEMETVFSHFRREVIPGQGHRILGPEFARLVGDWLSDLGIDAGDG